MNDDQVTDRWKRKREEEAGRTDERDKASREVCEIEVTIVAIYSD